MDIALREVRYALRRLRGSPGFTVAATLTMALAIGATTSVFSVADGVLLKALPYQNPERILTVWDRNVAMDVQKNGWSEPDYLDFRTQSRSFAELASSFSLQRGTVVDRDRAERVYVRSVTPNYFEVMGLKLALGRPLSTDSGGPDEVVIGYGFWQRRFQGQASALGQTLMVDESPYRVVGVLPAGVPDDAELWFRESFRAEMMAHRNGHVVRMYVRLKPGVTVRGAQRELETIAGRLAIAYPHTDAGWKPVVVPLVDDLVGDVRPALLLLLAAAACVLLIGAANVANLFLVRHLARERELAMRAALGATRGRIARELVTEAGVLGLVAAALGVGLALAGVKVLRALAPPGLPRVNAIGVDARAVAFCTLMALATVLLFGVLPAWHATRGVTQARRRYRLQDLLVVTQVAVALVLLTGAGLLVDSFDRFARMDLGFRPDNVLTARISVSDVRYPDAPRQVALAARVAEQVAAEPGVLVASAATTQPGGADLRFIFGIVGDPPGDPSRAPTIRPAFVGPDYFRAMGMVVRRGRGVLPSDGSRDVKVAVLDETLARRFFAGRDPIGQRIVFPDMPDTDTLTVVGVVTHVEQGGLVADATPLVYGALAQLPIPFDEYTIALRSGDDPRTQTAALRRAVAKVDPTVPVFDVKTMRMRVADSVGTMRFSTFLASLFAVVALILGMVGIYSVLAYMVSQRRRDIGIRLALGAQPRSIMGHVLRRALTLALAGIGLGSVAAWWLTRALAGLLYGVRPHDPGVFVGAAIVFALVALAAGAVPAFRATRVNPALAMR